MLVTSENQAKTIALTNNSFGESPYKSVHARRVQAIIESRAFVPLRGGSGAAHFNVPGQLKIKITASESDGERYQ